MHPTLPFWIGFHVFVLGMLALDLGVLHRRAHVVGAKEAALWTALWVGLALVFAGGLAVLATRQTALTFLTGYVIEESLSVDNIFVIVVIFAYFRIPAAYQHRVLFWGIIGALLMRGFFIAVGGALLGRFEWLSYVFGAIVLLTAVRLAWRGDEGFAGDRDPVLRTVRRLVPVSDELDGQRFFTRERTGARRLLATPLFLTLVLIEVTDLLFATDSIPAIFAITRDVFIVYTSNVFAVLGLRSLYFLLADAVQRFHYLNYGIAFVLAFVGLKMILASVIPVSTGLSLVVVVAALGISIGASIAVETRSARQRP
jgi:TerC family integral membrane protein